MELTSRSHFLALVLTFYFPFWINGKECDYESRYELCVAFKSAKD